MVSIFSICEHFLTLLLAVVLHWNIFVVGTVHKLLQVFLPGPIVATWSRLFTLSRVLKLSNETVFANEIVKTYSFKCTAEVKKFNLLYQTSFFVTGRLITSCAWH